MNALIQSNNKAYFKKKKKFINDYNEWKRLSDLIGKEYYLLFLKNIDFLEKELLSIKNNLKPGSGLSDSQNEIINIIYNFEVLFSAITYDLDTKKISYDEDTISRFTKIKKKKEIKNINLTFEDLKEKQKTAKGKKELVNLKNSFNLFLSFYNEAKTREKFVNQILIKEARLNQALKEVNEEVNDKNNSIFVFNKGRGFATNM